MRIAWISALAIATVLCSSSMASGHEPTQLISGLNQERSLGPGENQVYMVSLREGEAILGEADQHGVDLVIVEFGPGGKLIRTVDSPNGTEGPEPIDLTAITTVNASWSSTY